MTISELIQELQRIPNQQAETLEDIADGANVFTYIRAMESLAQHGIKNAIGCRTCKKSIFTREE